MVCDGFGGSLLREYLN